MSARVTATDLPGIRALQEIEKLDPDERTAALALFSHLLAGLVHHGVIEEEILLNTLRTSPFASDPRFGEQLVAIYTTARNLVDYMAGAESP